MVCATGIHLRFSGYGHRDCGTYKKCSEAPRPSTEEKIGCKHKIPGDGVTGERPRQRNLGYAAAGGAQRADSAEVGRLKRCLAAAPTNDGRGALAQELIRRSRRFRRSNEHIEFAVC